MYSYHLWRNLELPHKITLLKAPSFRKITLVKTSFEGGEGILYKIEGVNNFIAKVFKKQRTASKKEEKIHAFISLFKELTKETYWKNFFNEKITMPRARLFTDDKVFAGFIMNYIDTSQAISLKNFIEVKYREYKRYNDWLVKLHVAKNFVDVIKDLHRIGIVAGDLNTRNIFIRKNASVVLIDCDSMQLHYNGKIYPVDAMHPDITPPELMKGKRLNFKSDVYIVAILVYRILMKGFTPFNFISRKSESREEIILSGKNIFNNPHPPKGLPPLEALGPYLLEVLPKCLDVDPNRRPFLDELSTALLFTIRELKMCSNGHITPPYLGKCFLCGSKTLNNF